MFKLQNALLNAWRLFANEPPDFILHRRKVLGEDRIHVKAEILRSLNQSDCRPVFVIGAWGSGKTTFVRNLEPDLRAKSRYLYRSFFAVSTPNEAYLNLLPRPIWIGLTASSLVVLAAIGQIAISKPSLLQYREIVVALVSVATFLFVCNKMKAFYIVSCLLNSRLWGNPFITVIDDVERSSLPSADVWAILSNLWMQDHKYLILLGYGSDDEKTEIIQRAIKLEGHLVFLPTDYNVNFKIAGNLDGSIPFSGGEWFGRLTPRDIVGIFVAVEKEATSYAAAEYRSILYVNHYFLKLLERLEVKHSEFTHLKIGTNQDMRHLRLILSLRSWGSGNINPLFRIGRELQLFQSTLKPEIEQLIIRQPESTIVELFQTDNIFQIRRLFGSFVGTHG
ncbi:MAG: ATP-binding protein [Elusimicrobia bacterium]|nr:ATP-binding protein [Elusimicrobiota bacterium]